MKIYPGGKGVKSSDIKNIYVFVINKKKLGGGLTTILWYLNILLSYITPNEVKRYKQDFVVCDHNSWKKHSFLNIMIDYN